MTRLAGTRRRPGRHVPGCGRERRIAALDPAGRPADDEGGPGDTPASVAWLRAGRGTGYKADADRLVGPPLVEGRRIDPESGQLEPPPRSTDGARRSEAATVAATDKLGRPTRWDPPAPRRADAGAAAAHSSVARIEPEPPPQPRGGSTVGLSDWERWLEFCARIDGFPRHLSIHSGGMLVTAAPLIDIAPIERATMVDRVVVQFDKRDVETLKLIKLDLLGLGMLAAMDETLQLIEHDCAVCLDLDRLPEDVPEVFEMLQAADTVGVFQVESRAQMQTLPKSRPKSLDDLVVEVAIIRPGPIQGNAVHPFLRRKQGLEPVTYLHPSLEPVLKDSMGVILYQEQVMRIAIEVAGFTPAESDGFRRAMGTWRSSREMEKLHRQFVEGCMRQPGMTEEIAEELFRQVAAFASFGFAKSHAAAFARTAYESSFLKLFYPAQFLVGLINAQPMGFYPVEVLVNDAKRHGVVGPAGRHQRLVLQDDDRMGRPAGRAASRRRRDRRPARADPIAGLRRPVGRGAGPLDARGHGRLGRPAWAAPRQGDRRAAPGAPRRASWRPGRTGRSPTSSSGPGCPRRSSSGSSGPGALDSLGRPRRELLWQLREVAGASRGRVDGRRCAASDGQPGSAALPRAGRWTCACPRPRRRPARDHRIRADRRHLRGHRARCPPAGGRALPARRSTGWARCRTRRSPERRLGRVRIGGLVVTRQHPMTAKGTVFLALEDETGMVNVTLWPDTWARLRSVVRRHALLLVEGELQREGTVVNVVAHAVRALPEVAAEAGGPDRPSGVRQLGHAGMRRLG